MCWLPPAARSWVVFASPAKRYLPKKELSVHDISQPHVTLVERPLNFFVCVTHGNFMCTSTLQSFKVSCRYLLGPIFIYERALFPFGP